MYLGKYDLSILPGGPLINARKDEEKCWIEIFNIIKN